MSEERSALLHEITRPDFEDWLQEEETPVAIIGVGSIEQHGPHLPLGMDSLAAINIAELVAEKTNSVAVLPAWPGYSPHHMGFAGTITFNEDTLVAVLTDTIGSLAEHGVEKQLLLNAHGGNREIVAYVCRMASRNFGIQVVSPAPRVGQEVETGLKDFVTRMDVHSGPGETGLALHLFPELVDMSRAKGFKPLTDYPEEIKKLLDPDREDLDIATQVFSSYIRDSHDFTETGVWGFADPNDADTDKAERDLEQRVNWLVEYIELWKQLPTIGEVLDE
jgi:creatinine amidohydrolase